METAEKCSWISGAQSRNEDEELPETKCQIYYDRNKGKLTKHRFKSGERWMTTSADVVVEVKSWTDLRREEKTVFCCTASLC